MSSSDRILFLNGGHLQSNNQKCIEYSNYCVLNNTQILEPNVQYNINPSYFKIYSASNDDLYLLDSSGLHFKIPSIMVISNRNSYISSITGERGFISSNGSTGLSTFTISDNEFDSTGLCIPEYKGISVFSTITVSEEVSLNNNRGRLYLRIYQIL